MQRPHPLQRAGLCRALAPAHRFRPRERSDDDGQDIGEHVDRGPTGLLDQRDIEVALLRIALDFRLVQRGKASSLEETLDRGIRPTDARALALFLQTTLARR